MRSLNGLLVVLIVVCAGYAMADDSPPLVNPVGPGPRPAAGKAPAAKPKPAPAGGKLTADSSVDEVLDALDRRGKTLKEFSADVALKEEDGLGLSSTRRGKVWFQKKGEDDGRIRVVFDSKEDEKRVVKQRLEYALDNGWLVDRDFAKRIQVRRQVLKPGQKINLLKLGEGPFPLPIGQDKKEVHRLFDVEKVPASKEDDPAGAETVRLSLRPKKGTDFAKKFSSIDVWVDAKTHMPARVETVDPSEENFKTSDLANVKVNPNPPLADKDLTPPEMDMSDWSVKEEAFAG